jgi:hypothetical protein
MSERVGSIFVIAPEPPRACEFCGAVEECRPYGPGGKQICHPCAMKPENKPEVERRMRIAMGGSE